MPHRPSPQPLEFRISTWNCFGMGQGLSAITATRAPAPPRFFHEDVIAECASPDVFCIQELFSRDAQQFFDGLGQKGLHTIFRDDNRPHLRSVTMRGSGLGIGARAPLVNTKLHNFPPPRVGWDRLARKGALYAQVAVGDVQLDVLTVHLQAGYDEQAAAVRAAQLAGIRGLIHDCGAHDRPFLVCGDFNINGLAHARGESEYRRLEKTMDGFDDLGMTDDLPTFDPRPDANTLALTSEPDGHHQRIDYIFYRAARGGAPSLSFKRIGRILDRPLARAAATTPAYASDHYGLTASFERKAA